MTLEESIDKAIKAYLDGDEPEQMSKLKPSLYNKKYFDDIDEEMFPSEEVKDKKVKK